MDDLEPGIVELLYSILEKCSLATLLFEVDGSWDAILIVLVFEHWVIWHRIWKVNVRIM